MSIVIAGWIAGLLVFSAFFMKTMVPLRVVAIASNVAFIAYALLGLRSGIVGPLVPILVLHSSLLPLNVIRLRELQRLIRTVNEAGSSETFEVLIPYMRCETHRKGDTLFRRGDAADVLYLIESGSVLLPEIGKRLSAGEAFGEVGLFAPRGIRSASAVCDEDCRLHAIAKDDVLELYVQNPRFGLFLIRMVSALVQENGQDAAAGARGPAAGPS
jgi:CRP/FNR family transcriptional regulator, cyclic AMP receptor protein